VVKSKIRNMIAIHCQIPHVHHQNKSKIRNMIEWQSCFWFWTCSDGVHVVFGSEWQSCFYHFFVSVNVNHSIFPS
jgi:hypothetical protein